MSRFLLILASLFFLSCSSTPPKLSAEQCEADDWRAIGISDGLQAAKDNQILRRMRECKRYGYSINVEDYKYGYVDGILHRCTERYGELVGYEVLPAREEVCPEARRAEYMRGYEKGRQNSVSDSLDPLLTKPEARKRREAREKELAERELARQKNQ